MQAYRFRILYDDQEDFLRDIEIKPGQTFKEFHDIILKSVDLEGKELASFFVCDRKWNKQTEITLINMMEHDENPKHEDDEDSPSSAHIPVSVMDEVKIRDVIEDPHQRFLFEYDFLNPRTFFIELIRILDADEKKVYPVCVKQEGALAAMVIPNYESFLDDPDEEAMIAELDDLIKGGDMEEEVDENFTTEPEW
ncbi:MAG: hypothetical protein HXX13_01640 [Bacteroidetes bacterium]|nr:hypothetical protein [Bacteroidota bacterium]